MKEKKNIDRLFQEKFKDFEKSPDDKVWDRIEATIKDKKEDRILFPLWLKLGGVAAVLIGILAIGNLIIVDDSNNEINSPIVEGKNNVDTNADEKEAIFTDDTDESEEQITDNTILENKSDSQKTNQTVNGNTPESSVVSENSRDESNQGLNTYPQKTANSKNDAVAGTYDNKKQKNADVVSTTKTLKGTDNKADDFKLVETKEKASGVAENKKFHNSNENDPLKSNPIISTEVNSEVKTELAETEEETTEKVEDISEAVAQLEEIDEEEKEEVEKLNRWNVAPNVSPVYFNSLGQGSPIDSQFNDNAKTGDVTMSYGINGSYAFNEKIKVRVGVNKVNLGYSTKNVIVFGNINARSRVTQNLSNLERVGNIEETAFISGANISNAILPNVLITNPKGSIDQELGFIEVPLEIEYNILNKKIDLNVIGGFSTFFLDRNEVFSEFEGERLMLGRATNINETSYSANIGLGINYNFTKNIDLSVEPTFKYQINTFENVSGDFRPYFIGVYSGIRFKF